MLSHVAVTVDGLGVGAGDTKCRVRGIVDNINIKEESRKLQVTCAVSIPVRNKFLETGKKKNNDEETAANVFLHRKNCLSGLYLLRWF